jgi:hypothetical protein
MLLDSNVYLIVGNLQIGYPMYKLQDKIRSGVCIHAPPHAMQF